MATNPISMYALENEIIEDKLHGNEDDIHFLMLNADEYNCKKHSELLLTANINETSEYDIYCFTIEAASTFSEQRDTFYKKYGVNLEIARKLSLMALANLYHKDEEIKSSIVNTIIRYRDLTAKNL
ncbi:hypothetical protein M3C31_00275 [Staphylococcus hominis]|uniref:hypothetical protein n=1 Tax=Staphylococcus hominis TaxID=1290 RepID=UPI0021A51AF6|nr:hypothetical protein [Staphylococcus hominis]MCT1482282.1 hypothetical protein [Staphylococcus hominis]